MLSLLLLLALAAPPEPETTSPRDEAIARYAARVEAANVEAMQTAKVRLERSVELQKKSLARAKRGIVNPNAPGVVTPADPSDPTPIEYPSAIIKRKAIEEAERRSQESKDKLAAFKLGKYEPPKHMLPLDASRLEVGQVGAIPGRTCLVLQVLDKSNALMEVSYLVNVPAVTRSPAGAAVQTKAERQKLVVWIKGRSTDGLTDGRTEELDCLLWVSGTRTYETATGTRTVFVLEPVALPKSP